MAEQQTIAQRDHGMLSESPTHHGMTTEKQALPMTNEVSWLNGRITRANKAARIYAMQGRDDEAAVSKSRAVELRARLKVVKAERARAAAKIDAAGRGRYEYAAR